MSSPKVHLHRTYNESWCNRDISHVRATYEASEASCGPCRTAYVKDAEQKLEQTRTEAAAAITTAEGMLTQAKTVASTAIAQAEGEVADRRKAVKLG